MNDITFGHFLGRVTATHVTTYFVAGLLAYTLLDYRTFFAFSVLLTAWCRRPTRAWGIVLGSLAGLAVLLSLAGVLVRP